MGSHAARMTARAMSASSRRHEARSPSKRADPRALRRRHLERAGAAPQDTGSIAHAAALYRLMAWLSPAYPVGAFSYSSGIEWAVEAGDISDADDACGAGSRSMIADGGGILRRGAVRACPSRGRASDDDGAARGRRARRGLRAVEGAPSGNDRAGPRLPRRDARGLAVRGARPLLAVWDGPVAYPVAVGVAAAGHGIALEPALHAYLHAVAANLISAGVRLIPLGQTDGQRVLAALEPIGRGDRASARSPRRSTTSAAPRSAPTSPACGTRRNTRGCSGHEPTMTRKPNGPLRVGVGGPVGSGKTALMDALCKRLRDRYEIAAITNDIYTKWDAEYPGALRRAGARAHRRRRDRRLPAHRDPRGRLDQSRRGRRHAQEISRPRSDPDRIRRRQSGRDLLARSSPT